MSRNPIATFVIRDLKNAIALTASLRIEALYDELDQLVSARLSRLLAAETVCGGKAWHRETQASCHIEIRCRSVGRRPAGKARKGAVAPR